MSTYDTPQDAYQLVENAVDEARELLETAEEDITALANHYEKSQIAAEGTFWRFEEEAQAAVLRKTLNLRQDGKILLSDDIEDTEEYVQHLEEYLESAKAAKEELEQQLYFAQLLPLAIRYGTPVATTEDEQEKLEEAHQAINTTVEVLDRALSHTALLIETAEPYIDPDMELVRQSDYKNSRGWHSLLPFT